MTKSIAFVTGFPGFIADELIERILLQNINIEVICLVQGIYLKMALAKVDELVKRQPDFSGRIHIVVGDITKHNLGLGDEDLQKVKTSTRVLHLAAIYDLSIDEKTALKVNVEGTLNVLDLCKELKDLNRIDYMSTCYVSGSYNGIFHEQDLELGQYFNNYYEKTKYLAEIEVRKYQKEGLPITIYRPSIVVGDSDSGKTQKYDGIYFFINWFLRIPFIAFMPVLNNYQNSYVNIVPRDFVTQSVAALSSNDSSIGKTYQLADPNPLSVAELIEELGKVTHRFPIKVPVSKNILEKSLQNPKIQRFVKIPAPVVQYLILPTKYDTTQTQHDLKQFNIQIPSIKSYLPVLIEFNKKNPRISSKGLY